MEVAASLGYTCRTPQPEEAATLDTIRLVTYERFLSSDRFYSEVLDGISRGAVQAKLSVQLLLLPDEQSLLTQTLQNNAPFVAPQGVILLGVDQPELLDAVSASGCVCVIVNGMDKKMRMSSVSPDYEFGGWLATQHLIGAGHKKIAHVTHPYRASLRQRLHGFCDALEEAGLPFDPAVNLIDIQSRTQQNVAACQTIEALLDKGKPDFTAFFCATDMMAMGVIQALTSRGYKVPEDFSVMGFDDLPLCELSEPTLCSVHVRREELGRQAIEVLLEHVRNVDSLPRRIACAVGLVKRDSVKEIV